MTADSDGLNRADKGLPDAVKGMLALVQAGPDALPKRRRSYYRRLKDQLASPEGRTDALLELAALSTAVSHFLGEEIRAARRNGIDVSRVPATKMLASYISTSRAILASFPEPTAEGRTLAEVVEAMTKPQTKPEGVASTSPSDSGALKPNGEAA